MVPPDKITRLKQVRSYWGVRRDFTFTNLAVDFSLGVNVFPQMPNYSWAAVLGEFNPCRALSSALREQRCSYHYLYLWDYRCWQVKNGTLPVCRPQHHLSSCQPACKKASGFPASSWKIHYSDWWITVALWSHFLVNIYSVRPETHEQIYNHYLLSLKKIIIISDVWVIHLCTCLTRKWICTEPISKTSSAWRSVTGLMMRMRLGSTLVRYVALGSSQLYFNSKIATAKTVSSDDVHFNSGRNIPRDVKKNRGISEQSP